MARKMGTTKDGGPFPDEMVEDVWLKAEPAGKDVEVKFDRCGKTMHRSEYGNTDSDYGWHIDHMVPVSRVKREHYDRLDDLSNLQPLQWENNLKKGKKTQGEWGCGR